MPNIKRADSLVCWICLSGEGELAHPCNCPEDRVVHKKCLARWQLQSAGRSEEKSCRFCKAELPAWKDSLTPTHLKPAIPVVSVRRRLPISPFARSRFDFLAQTPTSTGALQRRLLQAQGQARPGRLRGVPAPAAEDHRPAGPGLHANHVPMQSARDRAGAELQGDHRV